MPSFGTTLLMTTERMTNRETAGIPVSERWIRITGVGRAQYIEFDYIYGDADLMVELVMTLDALRTFSA